MALITKPVDFSKFFGFCWICKKKCRFNYCSAKCLNEIIDRNIEAEDKGGEG